MATHGDSPESQEDASQVEVPLDRRLFLQRGGRIVFVSAMAGLLIGTNRRLAGGVSSDEGASLLPLVMVGPFMGVSTGSEGLIAVGGGDRTPSVWTASNSTNDWAEISNSESFPRHATLLDVASLSGAWVAVGSIADEVVRETVDLDGNLVVQVRFISRPAIFLTDDGGKSWRTVLDGLEGFKNGELAGIAETPEGDLLVIGLCDGPAGLATVALRSPNGIAWKDAGITGVSPPWHGSYTMLSGSAGGMLLAARTPEGAVLYSSSLGREFAEVPGPDATGSTYLSAIDTESERVVAGVDAMGVRHVWIQELPNSKDWYELALDDSSVGDILYSMEMKNDQIVAGAQDGIDIIPAGAVSDV